MNLSGQGHNNHLLSDRRLQDKRNMSMSLTAQLSLFLPIMKVSLNFLQLHMRWSSIFLRFFLESQRNLSLSLIALLSLSLPVLKVSWDSLQYYVMIMCFLQTTWETPETRFIFLSVSKFDPNPNFNSIMHFSIFFNY